MSSTTTETEIGDGGDTSPKTHPRQTTASQWARMRPIIARLYQDERRTLQEVMQIMEEEHDFHATVRMYKQRIRTWGLDKKLKEDDVLQIMRILTWRPHDARAINFFVRGQLIKDTRIRNYIAQKPRVIERFRAGVIPGPESIRSVTFEEAGPTRQKILGLHDDGAGALENLLWSVKVYTMGCLDSRGWESDASNCWSTQETALDQISLHDEWHQPFLELLSGLTGKNETRVVGDALNRFFDFLPTAIKAHPPYFLASVMCMMLRLELFEFYDLSKIFIKHTAELGNIYYGPNHGLTRVLQQMSTLTAKESLFRHEQYVKLILECFEQHAGADNVMTFFMGVQFMAVRSMYSGIEGQLLKVVDRYLIPVAQPPPKLDPKTSSALADSAWKLDYVNDMDMTPRGREIMLRFTSTSNSPNNPPDALELARRHLKFHLGFGQFSNRTILLMTEFFRYLAEHIDQTHPDNF